jgi:methylase of polypeptide subunit release factors
VRHDYSGEGFKRVLTEERNVREDPAALAAELRRLSPDDPTATLIRLFHFGIAADAAAAEAALAPLELDRLAAMGVLATTAASVEPLVGLSPIAGVFVASDPYELRPRHHDHVAPIGSGTLILAGHTVRREIDTALDLGTGSGFQALHAARHARHVVATDINPRALRFVEFNALLNDRSNIEVRQGSVFEPVEGETFDLVVSNPPYVISPESTYAFRDSGVPGDAFAEALVRALPAYLRPGGFAHLLVEWSIAPDEESLDPLRRWVAGSGCDTLVFNFGEQDPLEYAVLWNRTWLKDPELHAEAMDRWLEHLEQLGITRIGWGLLSLRRRSGRNWLRTRTDTLREKIEPSAHHVERAFDAEDYLAEREDDDALLDERLALAEDAVLDVEFTVSEGRRLVRAAMLVLRGGFGLRVTLDELTLELLSRLDERRPVRELVAELDVPGKDLHEVEAVAAPAIRRLIELGFVIPGPSSS